MPIFLETKRLILKKPELEGIDDLYQLQSDPDVMKFIGKGVRTKKDVEAFLDAAIQHHKKHGFSFCSVFEKDSGNFIGQAGLFYLGFDDTQPEIELGYRLHKAYWQKGYAVEIANALIKWGFNHLSVEKLVAVIRPDNEKSRRVLERINMHYLGRSYYHNDEVAKYEIYKNAIDYNKIQLIPATLKDHPIIQNMTDFYAYDLSGCMSHEKGWEQLPNGRHEIGIDYLKYWETENTFPFLIRYFDELVGFVIIDKKGSNPDIDFNMAQFFILAKFKNKGIGRYIANQCFDKFSGIWEIRVMPGNEGAYRFWRAIIGEHTKKNYKEYTDLLDKKWMRNFFRFESFNKGK